MFDVRVHRIGTHKESQCMCCTELVLKGKSECVQNWYQRESKSVHMGNVLRRVKSVHRTVICVWKESVNMHWSDIVKGVSVYKTDICEGSEHMHTHDYIYE